MAHPLAVKGVDAPENPLLWPILSLLERTPSGWKVHTLANALCSKQLMPQLDEDGNKDLFKRNFLIMNALYQLQETLFPQQWLQVQAMDIVLMRNGFSGRYDIDMSDPLREYYSDWHNYEADEKEITRLLRSFWNRYHQHVHQGDVSAMSRVKALRLFELCEDASQIEIRKRWRKLALRWHPDRKGGDTHRFRELCNAWQLLRENA